MRHTLEMPKHEAALERLHRARCIVTTIATRLDAISLVRDKPAIDTIELTGPLLAASELIMQSMAFFHSQHRDAVDPLRPNV